MKYQYPENGMGLIMVNKEEHCKKIFSQIILILWGVVILFSFLFCLVHEPTVVRGESMQPTMNKEYYSNKSEEKYDIVLINYMNTTPVRGKMIVADYRDYSNRATRIVKRIIALEGDTIKIDWDSFNKKLNVRVKPAGEEGNINDEKFLLKEDYILKDETDPTKDASDCCNCANSFNNKAQSTFYNPDTKKTTTRWDRSTYVQNEDGSITINKGYFFYLGDNRGVSEDGSELGPVPTTIIQGTVVDIYPYDSFLNKVLRFFGYRAKQIYNN